MASDIPAKIQYYNLLHDFYGELLTKKQSVCFAMHYMEDYSLSEIGKHYDITPQAVADLLKRTCSILQNYEAKLGLLRAYEAQKDHVHQTLQAMDALLAQIPVGTDWHEALLQIRQSVEDMPANH